MTSYGYSNPNRAMGTKIPHIVSLMTSCGYSNSNQSKIKPHVINPRELSSVGKGYCILYAGAGVRTPDTPLLHILYVWAIVHKP